MISESKNEERVLFETAERSIGQCQVDRDRVLHRKDD